jgi:UDP-N-acetyl-D-mannosaminuronate dehydrogenase
LSIGIVGLGYVGLPLAVSFAEAGEQVIGVDVGPQARPWRAAASGS